MQDGIINKSQVGEKHHAGVVENILRNLDHLDEEAVIPEEKNSSFDKEYMKIRNISSKLSL